MPDSNSKGGRKPRVSDEDLLEVFRSTSDPVLSTAEVADAVPIKRRGTLNRLQVLAEDGELESKQIGGRNTVWWYVGGAPVAPDERANDDHADEAREIQERRAEESADTVDESGHTHTEGEDLAEKVRRYLEAADAPPKTEHGRNAVIDVFRYLREHGTAKTGEIQDAVYPDYTDEWGTARTMWNGIDRYLEGTPGIEKAGYGKWAYAGDGTVREEVGRDA